MASRRRADWRLTGCLGVIWCLGELSVRLGVDRHSSPGRTPANGAERFRPETQPGLYIITASALSLGIGLWHEVREERAGFRFTSPVLMLSGITLRLWAVRSLGALFTLRPAILQEHHLVQAGPYRFVRHPGYCGSLLSALGLAVSTSSWSATGLSFVIVTGSLTRRIMYEEELLTGHFGQEYEDFCASRARLVPGLL